MSLVAYGLSDDSDEEKNDDGPSDDNENSDNYDNIDDIINNDNENIDGSKNKNDGNTNEPSDDNENSVNYDNKYDNENIDGSKNKNDGNTIVLSSDNTVEMSDSSESLNDSNSSASVVQIEGDFGNTSSLDNVSQNSDSETSNGSQQADPSPHLLNSLSNPNGTSSDGNTDKGSVKGKVHTTKKNTVKIPVPSIVKLQDDDVAVIPKEEKQQPVKGSKLFSLLPAPKNKSLKERDRPLVPHAVSKRIAKTDDQDRPKSKSIRLNETSASESDDFFSLKSSYSSDSIREWTSVSVPESDANLGMTVSTEPRQQHGEEISDSEYTSPGSQTKEYISVKSTETNDEGDLLLDANVLKRLGGPKSNMQDVSLIDINEDTVMPDTNEWLTKQLTVETRAQAQHSHRRNEGPTTQQRRKHQITYLAFQAKEKELELKNQWSQSRISRKQTQSKYGF